MHGGNLLEAKERYGRNSFIDLSANINPFGPPEGVWEAIQNALPKIVHYPDSEYRRLRKGLAQSFRLSEDWILLGNGAGELLFSILQALQIKSVLIPIPAFSEYERAARASGAEIQTIDIGEMGWRKVNFQDDTLSIWRKKLQECELVFLNTPHNPTGTVLDKEQFKQILALAQEQGTWVVFDESFVDFLDDNIRWTARDFLKDYSNLIVLYSMTKFYSLPGLRLGVVFALPQQLNVIKEQRDPWSVNILAEEAGIAAIEDQEYPKRVRKLLQESKESFFETFNKAGFSQFKLMSSSVNFALIQILKGQSKDIVAALGKRGVLVRDCGSFQGLEGEFIRIAIKDIPSMQTLIDELMALSQE
jgi:threonine-phosphate decarboxylase